MKLFCLLLFQLLPLIRICHAKSSNTTLITDLQMTTIASFVSEYSGLWTISNLGCSGCPFYFTSLPNTCDIPEMVIYGGPKILGPTGGDALNQYYQRIYPGVTISGAYIGIQMEFFVFSSGLLFQNGDGSGTIFSVKLNTKDFYRSAYQHRYCSVSYTDSSGVVANYVYQVTYKAFFSVSGVSSLTLQIQNRLSGVSTLNSFGFRNILIYTGAVNGHTEQVSANFDSFPCLKNYFWNGTGCEPICNSSCLTCFGPKDNECLTCQSSLYNYNNGSCLSSCDSPLTSSTVSGKKYCNSPCGSQYYYANTSCSSTCLSPLVKQEDSVIKLCINPCPVNDFLYSNEGCQSTCPSPLLSRTEPGVKFCWSPCPSVQFLYANRSCGACPVPFSSQTVSDIKYCNNPCGSNFLYPDGTCQSTCPSPLQSDPSVKYCWTTCSSTQYLYANGSCGTCSLPFSAQTTNTIKYCKNPCGSSFLYPDGTCKSTCPSPLLSRTEPGVKYCWSSCPSAQFLYANGSCLACPLPFVTQTVNNIKYCKNPCGSLYMNSDGNCQSSCPSPLRSDPDVKYCWNPCSTNQYLYPNSTCNSVCDSPLAINIQPEAEYCENPCPDSNDYLYPDGSCLSQCPYPLLKRIESIAKFCFTPCVGPPSDIYLYPDGSCVLNCPQPYIKSQLYNVNQCSSPCQDPQKEYFYEAQQECKAICEYPYEPKTIDGVKFCSQTPSQMTEKEIEETKKMISSVKSQRTATEAGMKTVSALSSGKPGLSWLAGQDTMLYYIRYINLNYTEKLKLVLFLQGENPFDFNLDIKMPKSLEDKLKNRELPETFETYEVQSNFLNNSWDMLSTGLLVLGIILVLSLLKIFTINDKRIDKILAGILASLKWNTLLMVILGSFGQMYFDASMQLQVGSVGSFWEIISLCSAIIMILVGLAILALSFKIVKDIWESRNEEISLEEKEKKWKNFELFFEGYKRNSLASFSCMVIFLSRQVIFNLIIANLYNYPLLQSSLMNIITFGMVGFMISQRPLKNTLEFVQLFLNEVFVMIVSICALIIAIMDKAEIQSKDLRNDVCNTIIRVIYIFSSLNLAFLVIQVLLALFSLVKLLKRLKAESKLNPRGILNTLFGDEENVAIENKDNNKLPVQVHRPREIHQNLENSNMTEEINITNYTIQQMNETEFRRETSGIFLPRTYNRPRYISSDSRNIENNLSFLDRSAVEMLPSEEHILGLNTDLSLEKNRQVVFENNERDEVIFTEDPLKVSVQEKRGLDLPDTISQYRKMRNYLRRRNRERKQQE